MPDCKILLVICAFIFLWDKGKFNEMKDGGEEGGRESQLTNKKFLLFCIFVSKCNFFSGHNHLDYKDLPTGCTGINTFDNPNREQVGPRQLHFLPCYVQSGRTNVKPGPGMALHLEHGSLLFEASAIEFHGATRVHEPNFYNPQRFAAISFCALVCDVPNHGHGISKRSKEWRKKFHM